MSYNAVSFLLASKKVKKNQKENTNVQVNIDVANAKRKIQVESLKSYVFWKLLARFYFSTWDYSLDI